MKNLVLSLLALMFVNVASAESVDRAPIIATAQGYYENLRSVALLADQRLQIVTVDEMDRTFLKTVVLANDVFQRLAGVAQRVGDAEIASVKHLHICLTFAAVIPRTLTNLSVANYDYQTSQYSTLHAALSERGCHVRQSTYPVNPLVLEEAVSLREQLVLLAMVLK
jgi:hypothetical protein